MALLSQTCFPSTSRDALCVDFDFLFKTKLMVFHVLLRSPLCEAILFERYSRLDPVYTGTEPNGSIPVWVQIGFPFTLELLDPYRCRSAIRTSLGPLSKVYPFGSVPVEIQCKLLERIRTGTDCIRDNEISHLEADLI